MRSFCSSRPTLQSHMYLHYNDPESFCISFRKAYPFCMERVNSKEGAKDLPNVYSISLKSNTVHKNSNLFLVN